MKVLHLMAGGGIGGIEVLLRDFSSLSKHENIFCVLWGKDQPISIEIKKRGFKVIELESSHRRVLKPINDALNICRNEGVDVIIAHHSAPLSHLILLAAKRKIPTIKTIAYAHSNIHDWPVSGSIQKRLRGIIFRKSFNQADCVIAISKSVRDSITDVFHVDGDKIKVVYNGVSLEIFAVKNYDSESDRTIVGEGTAIVHKTCKPLSLIYVGRLIKQKGVQNILKGIQGYHLTIVGEGPYRTELEKQSEGVDAQFLGSRNDIPELLAKADIFVHLPEWEEGFGITIVEAMAAGKICVCGNRGAIPEIIDHAVDGFLVNDIDEFRSTLEMIEEMSFEERGKIEENAKMKADRFSIVRYTRSLDELVRSI